MFDNANLLKIRILLPFQETRNKEEMKIDGFLYFVKFHKNLFPNNLQVIKFFILQPK